MVFSCSANFALRLDRGACKRRRLDFSCASPSFLQAWNIACRLRDVARGVGAEGLHRPSLLKLLPQNWSEREVTWLPRSPADCPTACILSRFGSRCCWMRVAHSHREMCLPTCSTVVLTDKNHTKRVSHAENVALATVLHRRSPPYLGMLDYVLI